MTDIVMDAEAAAKLKNNMENMDILSGVWENSHDSKMTMKVDEDGNITGSYVSGVSQVDKTLKANHFMGRVQPTEYGWIVTFIATFDLVRKTKKEDEEVGVLRHTNTAWNANVYSDNVNRMNMFWLMVTEKTKHDGWLSTMINQDIFTRMAEE